MSGSSFTAFTSGWVESFEILNSAMVRLEKPELGLLRCLGGWLPWPTGTVNKSDCRRKESLQWHILHQQIINHRANTSAVVAQKNPCSHTSGLSCKEALIGFVWANNNDFWSEEKPVFKTLITMRNSWEMGFKTPKSLPNDREQIPTEISAWSQYQPEKTK